MIVVSSNASESEKYAASELKYYIDSIGQVNIPIVSCGKGDKGKRIIVGYNTDSKQLFPQIKEPLSDDEGFTYRSKNGDIIIVGGKDRGTMYGVFSFLENELNCRWFAEDCTIIPKHEKYSFLTLDCSETPAFFRRSMLFTECKDEVFRLHCRTNERIVTSPKKPVIQKGGNYCFLSPHTVSFLLPVEKYFDNHPEYYALKNGKRQNNKTQPCFTNPDVLRICLEELRLIMRTYPEISIIGVSGYDNWTECECTNCINEKKRLGSYSDLVLNFINSIADSLRGEFPNNRIEYLAYQNTLSLPKSIKPHENVVVRVCAAGVCHTHGIIECTLEKSAQLKEALVGWKDITSDLYFWEYASSFSWYNIPYPNLVALQDNLRFLKSLGLNGIFVEGNHNSHRGEFSALRIYVLSKLLWNPNCNLDSIVDDFLNGYYGSSAPAIKEYLYLLYSSIDGSTHLAPMVNYKDSYYTSNILRQGRDIFDKAKKLADDQNVLRRIEIEEVSLNVLDCLINPKEAKKKGIPFSIQKVIERDGLQIGRNEELQIFNKKLSH